MKKQKFMIDLIMTVIMSIAMGLIASFVVFRNPATQTPPFPILCLTNIGESIIVGVVVALIIPLGKIGNALTKKANAKPPSLKYGLINSIPMAVGNSVIISAVVSFVNIAQAHGKMPADQAPPLLIMWFSNWGPLLIPSILISYVLALLIAPVVVWIVRSPKGMK